MAREAGDLSLTSGPALPYRLAMYLNDHPEVLPRFFATQGALEAFATTLTMLKPAVKAQALRIANRLIIKIASQVADSGFQSGPLTWSRQDNFSLDLDAERTVEAYLNDPAGGLAGKLVFPERRRERRVIILMLDHSYSMKGIKMLLAGICAASVAAHCRQDYGVIVFSKQGQVLKPLSGWQHAEVVLEKIFNLNLDGDTNLRSALELGLKELRGCEKKTGLLLTDGNWNTGGDPQELAVLFDKLNIICFPPANPDKIKELALAGKGAFMFVTKESEIPGAITRCLG